MNSIHFVFIGDTLPSYASASMELAARNSGLPVTLIANARSYKPKKGPVDFIPIESFYDPLRFEGVRDKVYYTHHTRKDFWLVTLERLFVLQQYADIVSPEPILHAELDQLLFRADLLLERLKRFSERGIFLPFHNAKMGVASILYCNASSALESLVRFAETSGFFPNEMVLLSNWAQNSPDNVFALSTISQQLTPHFQASPEGVPLVQSRNLGGIADAMQLGFWVGGEDSRNVPLKRRPSNLSFLSAGELGPSKKDLSGIKFDFPGWSGGLHLVSSGSDRVRVFNLHLHSKIHPQILRNQLLLEKLFLSANNNSTAILPYGRLKQISQAVLHIATAVRRRPQDVISRLVSSLNLLTRRRPSSRPLLSGDTFWNRANHVFETHGRPLLASAIRPGDIVFCESDRMEELFELVLVEASGPVVLVLGNSDRNLTPSDFDSIPTTAVSQFFSQNLVEKYERAEVLPIGLENWWRSKNGIPRHFKGSGNPPQSRIFRVMWEFSIHTNERERSRAARALSDYRCADRLGKVIPAAHRKALKTYGFVACPPGNGLDTHRAWEAMYLNCVPIVARSFLTERYESLGLPVWIVDDYADLQNLNETQLREIYWELFHKFASPALGFEFWEDQLSRAQSKVVGHGRNH